MSIQQVGCESPSSADQDVLEPFDPQVRQTPTPPQFREDEIMVTLQPGEQERLSEILDRHAMVLEKRFQFRTDPDSPANRTFLLRIPTGITVDDALRLVAMHAEVEHAQPNYLYQLDDVPTDDWFYGQWGMRNTGDNTAYTDWHMQGPDPRVAGTDIELDQARDLWAAMTFDTVVVGIIDSGSTTSLADLLPNRWENPGEILDGLDNDNNGYIDDLYGWDFFDNDNDPSDENSHGTHVAGAVGAACDNSIGVCGVAPNVRLMALRFIGPEGGATSDAIEAIYYGIDNGARVLNNSWGGGAYEQNLYDAIQAAYNNGVLFVAAAGNDGTYTDTSPHYPSSYNHGNVISVAASTPWRDMADFSNYGIVSVDIAAPGDEILSTTPGFSTAVPNDYYAIGFWVSANSEWASWSGTSMASPMVAGAAAVLYGVGAELWPEWGNMSEQERMLAVRDRILTRSERWASLSGLMATGGHLNLASLLDAADTTPPSMVSMQVKQTGDGWAVLCWTAVADANYYDVRYQQGTSIDFASATPILGAWTPSAAGGMDCVRLDNLTASTLYTVGAKVVDDAGNASGIATAQLTTEDVAFFDDMSSAGGWTADAPWARVSDAGNDYWTDSPDGNYQNNMLVALTSQPIAAFGTATLSFLHQYDIKKFDEGRVEVQAENNNVWGNWTRALTFTDGAVSTWKQESVIAPVVGDRIRVRFQLYTNNSNSAAGWSIDDVWVSVGTVADTLLFEDDFVDASQWSLTDDWTIAGNLDDSRGTQYPDHYRASAALAWPLDLANATAVRGNFTASFAFEQNYDFLFWEYSLDGVQWRTIAKYTGTQSGTANADLTFLAGMPSVWLRFRSFTDYAVTADGAQLDNFQVWIAEQPDPSADVSVQKSCPLSLGAGEQADYTVIAQNLGSDTAIDVVVTDTLPAGVAYASATPAPDVVNGQELTWNLGDMAAAASTTIGITVDVTTASGALFNTVSASTTSTDADSSNNNDSCSAAVLPPDVEVLSATAGDGRVVIEWVTPNMTSCASVRLCWSTSGYPTDPLACGVDYHDRAIVVLDAYDTWTHEGVTNGETHYYTSFVSNVDGAFSTGSSFTARPFDTTAAVKWVMATGAASISPPGVMAGMVGEGAVVVVADNLVYAMEPTAAGGTWPKTAPFDWIPTTVGAHAPGRPAVIPTTVIGGAALVTFLAAVDGRVYAVDVETGTLLWQSLPLAGTLRAAAGGMFSEFGGAYDLVFVGTADANDNALVALDAQNGAEVWRFTGGGGIGAIMSAVTVDYLENRLFFTSRAGGNSHTVWCLSFTDVDATHVWSVALGDVDAATILVDDRLYVGTNAGFIHALDGSVGGSGVALWSTPYAASGNVQGFIWPEFTALPRRLVFSTTDRIYSIIDLGDSAADSWDSGATVTQPSAPLLHAAAGAVYVGSADGALHALSATTGVSMSVVPLGDDGSFVGSPTYDHINDMLYVSTDAGFVYAVSRP